VVPRLRDYAILKAVQKTLAELARAASARVRSGSAARPVSLLLSTYGFHTIHGRAPTIATGIKLANPELDIWVVTGDGDGLSIGGITCCTCSAQRRSPDPPLQQRDLRLTKGQYSPTSRRGTRSPSTPQGSIENPFRRARSPWRRGDSSDAR